jgi:hypothetical protein
VVGIAARAAIASCAKLECHALESGWLTLERDSDGVTTSSSATCAAIAAYPAWAPVASME